MIEILAQITAGPPKPFSAEVVLFDDRVVEASDVVKYMRKWSRARVRDHCTKNGWKISIVYQMERERP